MTPLDRYSSKNRWRETIMKRKFKQRRPSIVLIASFNKFVISGLYIMLMYDHVTTIEHLETQIGRSGTQKLQSD